MATTNQPKTFQPAARRRRAGPWPAVAAVGVLSAVLALAGCNSNRPPPSGPSGMPGPSGSPGGLPGGSSGPRSSPSGGQSGGGMPGGSSGGAGTPGGSSGGSGMPGGSSGGSGMPGGSSGGSGRPGGGAELPGAGGSGPTGGQAGGGLPGSGSGSGGAGGDESGPGGEGSWEDGLPGGSEDGWETSNQVPGGTADIPPMPSDRGKPPGSGDGELDGALEDFDGEILSEREVIRKRSNETAGSGGASLPEASAGQPGGSGNADMPERGGPLGVPSNRNSPPPPSPVASAGVPDDIPDAKDDDIIARQLREAALQESDPELKEKLWDEYRRYKGI